MNFDFSSKHEPLFYGVLAGFVLIVFGIDYLVPLGTAVWIIYLVPVVVSYLAWRQTVPIFVSIVATALVVVAFTIDRPGIDPSVALLNRMMGVATLWVLAVIGVYFIRNKLAVRRQEWLQTGQTRISREMSGDITVEKLGEQVVTFLGGYLDARAVALFVHDGDRFVRLATNGVPADAPIPAEVRRGDGFLGQAIAEDRGIEVNNLPDGYLYFGSSLGRAKPATVLISPTREDNEVNGVIELGYLGKAPQDAMALLERISGAIGIALRSAQYRARLHELLEETRRQAEDLRAHAEELSAANEELEEQSQALQDSQARLELQQAELEQSNAQLDEQTQLLEAQRDDLARTQTVLQDHARELETASRYKSEFVANMSHELRTPLNSLLIMARLLADNRGGNLTDEQVSFAQTIEASGNDLLTLINDILDLSKIEAGKLDLQPENVAIAGLIDKITKVFRPAANEKGLEVRSEIASKVPATIVSDPQRLEQVLKNFLSNAVKFTQKGEITLSVALEPDGRVVFSVRDTGIGIADDQQDAIFEAFRQADGTINRRYGGTGLGLSISRELASLLGGDVRVESAVGKGSTFSIVLPQTLSEPIATSGEMRPGKRQTKRSKTAGPTAAIVEEKKLALTGGKAGVDDDRDRLSPDSKIILVVEDDSAFSRILVDLARELGFKCIAVSTADEGVVATRQYMPHAVILDMGLPDHTGMSVLDRLKRDTRTRHIPVHVVSVDDYTQTALAYGAIGYMLKPVKREELVQTLENLETRLSHAVRRVLIVEDDPAQLKGLSQLLSLKDVETVGCPTAADCLERLRLETFDCMVLDMTLPDASGFEVLERLASDDTFSFPPVIVYTARELSQDEELRLRKYSKSIIIKGAKSPERLMDEVTLFLHQVVSELPARQQQMLTASLSRDSLLEGRRILVVEDDVRNVYAITSIFEPHGATVRIARNGKEALSALEQADNGNQKIDLVLMDVMMPEMDGLTATREIRLRQAWKSLPVIMLTAKAMPDDQEQCLAAGANDYLAKPLDVDKLLSLARVWMPR
jgi:signal transduction histidine kinase/CheY-like chemotaxis protein